MIIGRSNKLEDTGIKMNTNLNNYHLINVNCGEKDIRSESDNPAIDSLHIFDHTFIVRIFKVQENYLKNGRLASANPTN